MAPQLRAAAPFFDSAPKPAIAAAIWFSWWAALRRLRSPQSPPRPGTLQKDFRPAPIQ